jgi:hypothetical protein
MALNPNIKDPVTPTASAPHLEALQQAWQEWRDDPIPSRFSVLGQKLAGLMETALQDAKRVGRSHLVLSTRIPRLPQPYVLKIKFEENGRRLVVGNKWISDFDEVVNTYYDNLLKKWKKKPELKITSAAYIRMGICQCAFIMERRRKNKAKWEESSEIDPDVEKIQQPEKSQSDHFSQNIRNRIWFYPVSEKDQLTGSTLGTPGLSIRYLYTDLRIHSGATTTDVASELGIHSSRLTAVRQELADLFPVISPKTWLPLGDFLPLEFSPEIMRRMDLIGVQRRFSLVRRAIGSQMQQRILFSKTILWEAYILARSFRYPEHDAKEEEPELHPDISKFLRQWSLKTDLSEKRCLILDITQK